MSCSILQVCICGMYHDVDTAAEFLQCAKLDLRALELNFDKKPWGVVFVNHTRYYCFKVPTLPWMDQLWHEHGGIRWYPGHQQCISIALSGHSSMYSLQGESLLDVIGSIHYGYWGEPERAPHWSVVFVYVGASCCARSVNKKIR